MTKALAWAEELQKDKGFSPMVTRLWKARVQLKMGDKAGAAITATEGIKAAETDKSTEYIRLNTEVLNAAKK